VNQIPPWTEVQGDIRLTPFYSITECLKKVEGYVAELNKSELSGVMHYFTVIYYVVKSSEYYGK